MDLNAETEVFLFELQLLTLLVSPLSQDGFTPLLIACERSDASMVHFLLEIHKLSEKASSEDSLFLPDPIRLLHRSKGVRNSLSLYIYRMMHPLSSSSL